MLNQIKEKIERGEKLTEAERFWLVSQNPENKEYKEVVNLCHKIFSY